MRKLTKHWAGACIVTAMAVLASVVAIPANAAGNRPDLVIGWTTWGDAEVVSKLATIILQQGMKKDVELTLADISVQYRGVADGDLDVMLMSWQPLTHKSYMARYGDRLEDLGPIYKGANLGLVVPAFIPESEVSSIADLGKPGVREKFGGQIQGISPNSGINAMTKEAMKAYGFDYELLPGTGPKMAMEIGKAVKKGKGIIATGWHPHWKWAKHDLRYLEDPKGIFGESEAIHAVATKGFSKRKPEIADFLKRIDLTVPEVETLMMEARNTSHREAIYAWIKNNPERIRYWMTGDK